MERSSAKIMLPIRASPQLRTTGSPDGRLLRIHSKAASIVGLGSPSAAHAKVFSQYAICWSRGWAPR